MISLRTQIRPDDIETIRTLVASTNLFRPNEVAVAVELVQDRLNKGECSEYHLLFADSDGTTIGYVCYGPITVSIHSFDIYWIVVDPQWQGKGVGRMLLREAEAKCVMLGGRQLYIETSGRDDYNSTRHFYLKCGYEREAVVRDFYAPGDDKVIYSRRIGDI